MNLKNLPNMQIFEFCRSKRFDLLIATILPISRSDIEQETKIFSARKL